MFDYVKCDYPLPGKPVEFVDEFQTKDLGCTLETITITQDGKISPEEYDNFTGEIEFYGNTISACGPLGQYTYDGEDAESVTFKAIFVDGKLIDIQQLHYEREVALSSKDMPNFFERGKGSELKENDSFVGKKLFLLWGGVELKDGYYVEVVYESDKQLVYENEGRLELIYRSDIGRLLYKDEEEARIDREFAKQKREDDRREYARKLKEKIAKRNEQEE